MASSATAGCHLIILPKWYPHAEDPQEGNFIKKHAETIAQQGITTSVLFVRSGEMNAIHSTHRNNLLEVTVRYSRSPIALINLFRFIRAARRGYHSILQQHGKPDLAAYAVLPLTFLLHFFLRGLPEKYIVFEHWSGFLTGQYQRKSIGYKMLVEYSCRHAKHVVVVSEFLKNAMISSGLKANYTVVPNVIRIPQHESPGRIPGRIVVVADLADGIKNISGILDAYAQMNNPDRTTELVIGGDGPDRSMLSDRAKQITAKGKSVTFRGRLLPDEVQELLASAQVVVVNSRAETFSMIVPEAFSCGTPVIATRCGGPEQFINEKSGLLIQADDTKALARSLETVLSGRVDFDEGEMKNIARQYSPQIIGPVLKKIIYHAAGK